MSHGLSTLEFANINGEPVNTEARVKVKREKAEAPAQWHRGWRVMGFPPGALEAAEKEHNANLADILSDNAQRSASERRKVPPPWDADRWLRDAKKTAVRSRPYEVPEAAQECVALATKAGWLAVTAVELKSDKSAA